MGQKGWVVLSHYRKFHSAAVATAAVLQHEVRCFYLPCANKGTWDKLGVFVRVFRRMTEIAETVPAPVVFEIHGYGRIKRVELQ